MKKSLKLTLNKVTVSKLNSMEEIKGGESVWCGGTGTTSGSQISKGYEKHYDENGDPYWTPCDRES